MKRWLLGIAAVATLLCLAVPRQVVAEDDSSYVAYVGEVCLFGGKGMPDRFLPCDGRTVSIEEYRSLWSRMGFAFGGDGQSTFKLPDYRSLEATLNKNRTDGKGLHYGICFDGVYPSN